MSLSFIREQSARELPQGHSFGVGRQKIGRSRPGDKGGWLANRGVSPDAVKHLRQLVGRSGQHGAPVVQHGTHNCGAMFGRRFMCEAGQRRLGQHAPHAQSQHSAWQYIHRSTCRVPGQLRFTHDAFPCWLVLLQPTRTVFQSVSQHPLPECTHQVCPP